MASERMLHHERLSAPGAEPGRWLFVLHGIFGAGRNWATIARRVVRERPEWGAVLVDLREHGGSQGFAPPHTLAAAAADVARLARGLGIRADAVLGHSFGGKVALTLGRDFPDLVDQLWIIDSTPESRPPGGGAAEMLAIVRRNPGPFPSRDAAVRALEAEGVAKPIAQWMSSNLEAADGEYRWRLDFDAMQELLQDFFRSDLWEVIENPPEGVEIHMIKAEFSDILSEEAARRIEEAGRRNGRVWLHRVPGGHWLNADNPDALVKLLVEGLPAAQQG